MASATSSGSPSPRASALAILPAPINPILIATAAYVADRSANGTYDWLKKPFSIRLARSSADTSTLRGVSRKTLSAIRCIPPSRA